MWANQIKVTYLTLALSLSEIEVKPRSEIGGNLLGADHEPKIVTRHAGTTHEESSARPWLGIPEKVNIDSGGKPNGVPERSEQPSERSDAGVMIVQEVFGFVN
jgi:hypothetical protein